jgi:hypothetical protein
MILEFLDPLPEIWQDCKIRHLPRLRRVIRHRLAKWNGTKQARAMRAMVADLAEAATDAGALQRAGRCRVDCPRLPGGCIGRIGGKCAARKEN